MRPTSRRILLAVALLAIIAVVIVVLQQPAPSDQQQIASQIEAMRSAAESKNTSGIMREISAQYHDSTISNPDQLAFILSRRIFAGQSVIRVQTTNSSITVSGDTATSVTNVHIDAGGPAPFDGNITLHWQREPSHRLLIFPDHVWRVVSAEYPFDLGGLD